MSIRQRTLSTQTIDGNIPIICRGAGRQMRGGAKISQEADIYDTGT